MRTGIFNGYQTLRINENNVIISSTVSISEEIKKSRNHLWLRLLKFFIKLFVVYYLTALNSQPPYVYFDDAVDLINKLSPLNLIVILGDPSKVEGNFL